MSTKAAAVSPARSAELQVRAIEGVIEHLSALLDTREMVAEDPVELALIDKDIASYARAWPDAAAQYIKYCQVREATEKHIATKMADPYNRSAASWAAREAKMRDLTLQVVTDGGPLYGDVHCISTQKGHERMVIENEEEIPLEFRVVIPQREEICGKAVEAALKEGREVPGARLERGPAFLVVR